MGASLLVYEETFHLPTNLRLYANTDGYTG